MLGTFLTSNFRARCQRDIFNVAMLVNAAYALHDEAATLINVYCVLLFNEISRTRNKSGSRNSAFRAFHCNKCKVISYYYGAGETIALSALSFPTSYPGKTF